MGEISTQKSTERVNFQPKKYVGTPSHLHFEYPLWLSTHVYRWEMGISKLNAWRWGNPAIDYRPIGEGGGGVEWRYFLSLGAAESHIGLKSVYLEGRRGEATGTERKNVWGGGGGGHGEVRGNAKEVVRGGQGNARGNVRENDQGNAENAPGKHENARRFAEENKELTRKPTALTPHDTMQEAAIGERRENAGKAHDEKNQERSGNVRANVGGVREGMNAGGRIEQTRELGREIWGGL